MRLRALSIFVMVLATLTTIGAAYAQSPFFGPEFGVTQSFLNPLPNYVYPDLNIPELARTDSGFVVVWDYRDYVPYPHPLHVRVHLLDAAANPIGSDIPVNVTPVGNQSEPTVDALAGGGFVVVWQSDTGVVADTARGIFGQRFASDGTAIGTEFHVNNETTMDERSPSVAALAGGGFVVTWSRDSLDPFPPPSVRTVSAQRFDAAGAPAGTEFQVAGTRNYNTDVAGTADGGFVVGWINGGFYTLDGVFGRRYDGTGAAAGTEFEVAATDTRSVSVLQLGTGNLVFAWSAVPDLPPNMDVHARLLDTNGVPVSSEFQLNTYTTSAQVTPTLALLGNGDFLAAWSSGGEGEIIARRYDSTAVPTGDEFRVNSYWHGTQEAPNVVADGQDGFLVTWRSDEGSHYIYDAGHLRATHVCVDTTADSDGDGIGDACDPCENPGSQTISVKPALRFKFVGTEQGYANDAMSLSGELLLPAGLTFSGLDPSTVPLRLRVQTDTHVLFDAAIPTGVFAGGGTAGWTLNPSGSTWSFRDKTGAPVQGIVGASLQDRSGEMPGQVRLKIKAKNGVYPLHPADLFANVTVFFGDGDAGECVETAFIDEDCSFGALDTRLGCRK